MINKDIQKKGLVFVAIVLFFGISVIPSAGHIQTVKFEYAEDYTLGFPMVLNNEDPNVVLEGDLGQNNWYITSVYIDFTYDPHIVDEIFYSINGGNWMEYLSSSIEVSADGNHVLEWYWVDFEGEEHTGPTIFFKIDQTLPTITLEKSWKKNGLYTITYKAVVSDATSDVERVEFYLDDILQETLMSPPYEWEYTQVPGESPIIVGTVYDFAGNSQSDDEDTTSQSFYYNNFFLSRFIQRIQSIIIWSQNVINNIFHLFSFFEFQ